jgi:hypothetical protein
MSCSVRRLAILFLGAALMSLPSPAATAAPAPPGFFGISPQGGTEASDYELMREAGVESVRMLLSWPTIEPSPASRWNPDWSALDVQVGLAAEQGLTAFLFAWGTPHWVGPRLGAEPVASGRQRREWLRFLRGAALRYGPTGRFWRENPALPERPVRQWEIWNEENIVTFSRRPDPARFARLIEVSGRLLHRLDPGSTVILGGLFGRPLQIPPNVASAEFLGGVYRRPGIERWFDGVALHPYVAAATALRGQSEALRRVMRRNGDARTPLYVTELGWGSDGFESRWERGPRGQARELDRAFAMLTANRLRWRIGGVWWFSWTDEARSCQFCDSAGLLTVRREAKPAWYRFNAWTGGDARTVPRASHRALRGGP